MYTDGGFAPPAALCWSHYMQGRINGHLDRSLEGAKREKQIDEKIMDAEARGDETIFMAGMFATLRPSIGFVSRS